MSNITNIEKNIEKNIDKINQPLKKIKENQNNQLEESTKEYTQELEKSKKKIALKHPKDKSEKSPKEQSQKVSPKSTKNTKAEEQFVFNEETINYFTKNVDARQVLIKHTNTSHSGHTGHTSHSYIPNDTVIICLLIKIGIIKEYCCSTPKCKVGKIWNSKPIQLILNRKNNIQNDLTTGNLDLICANCFMVEYGLDIFLKQKKEIIINCKICEFPLVKFKNCRKKNGICFTCENKMNKISQEQQDEKYMLELRKVCDSSSNNNTDNTDNLDTFDNTDNLDDTDNNSFSISINNPTTPRIKSKICSSNIKKKSNSSESIIKLNMDMPEFNDLIP